jgi:rhodanese-related sulfurtransferase
MDDLFENTGMIINGVMSLTPRETLQLTQKGAFLIDLRDLDFSDFKAFEAVNVISIPFEAFDKEIDNLNKEKYYILADSSGLKSSEFAKILLDKGFKNIASMAGGFVEWERDGLPVRIDVNEQLSGACACQLKARERGKS